MMAIKVCARWFMNVVRSNTFIYWAIAFYATCAMQWKPLWAACPFIVGSLLYRGYIQRRGPIAPTEPAVATEPVLDHEVPAFDPVSSMASPFDVAPVVLKSSVEPTLEHLPEVSILDCVNWAELAQPTWRRRGLDFNALIKPGSCKAFEPQSSSKVFSLIEEDEPGSSTPVQPVDCEFIYS